LKIINKKKQKKCSIYLGVSKRLFLSLPDSNKKHIKMELTHIEHIGIAVKSIDEAKKYYEEVLGLKCYAVEEVKDQKVKTAFFKIGQTKIELLESTDPEGPVGKFIEKKGEGIHHIAFAAKNIAGSLAELEEKGVMLIDKAPRKGAEGLDIGFLHPKSTFGVLTELCEDNNK
jgi:methylmalonyl-CoA/ethylmalonyl-CoA epimerase